MSALAFNPYALLADLEALAAKPANLAKATASLASLASLAALATSPAEISDDDYAYEERAAIMEFDGGMSRAEAEAQAAACLTIGA